MILYNYGIEKSNMKIDNCDHKDFSILNNLNGTDLSLNSL